MDNLELFDSDIIDIKSSFPDSEEDKQRKEVEGKDKDLKDKVDKKKDDSDKKIINNTINPLDGIEIDKREESVDSEEIEDKDDTEENDSEEDKELLQKVLDLKEIGALFLPDDYEIESLEKTVQDSENYRNSIAIQTVFNQLPDVDIPGVGNAKDLFAYMFEHGGTDIPEFKKTFGIEAFDSKNFDLSKDEDRRKAIDLLYQEKGFTDVKRKKLIDKIFEDMEDETEARDALEELSKMSTVSKQNHLQELEQKKIVQQKEAQRAFEVQKDILEKNDIVGGYSFSKEEKPKAINSLYKQVNVDGENMSEFDYKLSQVVLRNPELTLALSGILNTLSKTKDNKVYFDLSKLERIQKTKAVRNLKEITSRALSGKKKFVSTSDNDDPTSKNFNWSSVVDYSDLI